LPAIVERAPLRHAVEVGGHRDPRQLLELREADLEARLDQAADAEVPGGRIEARHRTRVQHGPLQGERLAGWKAARLHHLPLEGAPLVAQNFTSLTRPPSKITVRFGYVQLLLLPNTTSSFGLPRIARTSSADMPGLISFVDVLPAAG